MSEREGSRERERKRGRERDSKRNQARHKHTACSRRHEIPIFEICNRNSETKTVPGLFCFAVPRLPRSKPQGLRVAEKASLISARERKRERERERVRERENERERERERVSE